MRTNKRAFPFVLTLLFAMLLSVVGTGFISSSANAHSTVEAKPHIPNLACGSSGCYVYQYWCYSGVIAGCVYNTSLTGMTADITSHTGGTLDNFQATGSTGARELFYIRDVPNDYIEVGRDANGGLCGTTDWDMWWADNRPNGGGYHLHCIG